MVEVCANLDQELLSVVNEMKKELGFETLWKDSHWRRFEDMVVIAGQWIVWRGRWNDGDGGIGFYNETGSWQNCRGRVLVHGAWPYGSPIVF